MVWVDSPKFLCALSEMLTNVTKTQVHTDLPILGYEDITKTPKTGPSPLHILDSLAHIYCYMYAVITAVQVGPD